MLCCSGPRSAVMLFCERSRPFKTVFKRSEMVVKRLWNVNQMFMMVRPRLRFKIEYKFKYILEHCFIIFLQWTLHDYSICLTLLRA